MNKRVRIMTTSRFWLCNRDRERERKRKWNKQEPEIGMKGEYGKMKICFCVLCRKLVNKRTQRVNWTTSTFCFPPRSLLHIWFIFQLYIRNTVALSASIQAKLNQKQQTKNGADKNGAEPFQCIARLQWTQSEEDINS